LPPVLVVDDERNMRASIQDILDGEEYSAELAESAEQALEMLRLTGGNRFVDVQPTGQMIDLPYHGVLLTQHHPVTALHSNGGYQQLSMKFPRLGFHGQ